MIRNVMIATIVQRLKTLDISEIQSSTSRAICCWLEMVGFKMLCPIALGDTRRCDMVVSRAGFIRRPTPNSVYPSPFESRISGYRLLGLNQ